MIIPILCLFITIDLPACAMDTAGILQRKIEIRVYNAEDCEGIASDYFMVLFKVRKSQGSFNSVLNVFVAV